MLRITRLVVLCMAALLFIGITGSSVSYAAAPGARYIVVFNNTLDVATTVRDVAQAHQLEVGYVYEHALKGMSVVMPEGRLIALQNDPRVAYVVPDRLVTLQAQTVPTGIERIFADTNTNLDIDATDDYRVDVDVAVIDTGVDFQHPDLNVAGGVDCTLSSGGGPPWARTYYCSSTGGTGGDDDHYHGTHVAGTIGALDNGIGVVGVAPGAHLGGQSAEQPGQQL